MSVTKKCRMFTVLGVLLVLIFGGTANAQNVVVGVNVVNPMRASVTDQDTLLAELKAAQVHAIRSGITDDEKGIDFANAASNGRIIGITYFAWNSDPWAKKPEPDSIYRCGTLTGSGRLAVAPMSIH